MVRCQIIMPPPDTADRRRYRRVRAPILVRPISLLARMTPRTVNDISLGGIRTYADDPAKVGQRLEVELILRDGRTATVLVEVAWLEPLGEDAPAPYEVGLRLVSAGEEALALLAAALDEG
jgi:hypothetical protein